jgi:hypothetical protein
VVLAKEPDRDRDGDGLKHFHEVHKHLTDPTKRNSDGVPDGDGRGRSDFQVTIRIVVQVLRPASPEFLNDDDQDVRMLDERDSGMRRDRRPKLPFCMVRYSSRGTSASRRNEDLRNARNARSGLVLRSC